MSPVQSVAANLSSDARQKLAIEVLAKSQPVSQLAAAHQVSRKFLYEQGQKAKTAMDVWRDNSIGSTDNYVAHPKLSKLEITFSFANRIRSRHSIHQF
jgi:hypothetical protein